MKVVPELLCEDLDRTRQFYTQVLGFTVKYERPDERFIYFTRDGVDVMSEERAGPGRRWLTGSMEYPYGRGINLQWDVDDVEKLYAHVRTNRPESIYMPLETSIYRCGEVDLAQTQFIVQDPDGYLYRFCNA